MFMGYSLGELGSIFAMQAFAGLILFSVFVLMSLGLAIIFGQMGVINMAHGEFMILRRLYDLSHLPALPGLRTGPLRHLLLRRHGGGLRCLRRARDAGGMGLIRFLYKRPLDTLLATWGLSLVMQQAFRSIFGAREVAWSCRTG